MSLYVDKYRPKSLEELDYHPELSKRISTLAEGGDFPHCLFYGPSGAGKKTRIMATLRELYGPGVEKLRIDQRVFVTPSRRKLDVNVVQSNYHIELTPADVGNWDRSVVQDILKEIAQTQQVDLNAKKRFKVVVINEADLLSRDAQAALRRTMEKYTANLRVILCANSTSRIISPIKSRCLLLRVGAPSEDEICKVIQRVSTLASLQVPPHIPPLLSRLSSRNLRRALLTLESLATIDPTFSKIPDDHPLLQPNPTRKALNDALDLVPRPDWEKYAGKVAEKIISDQSPERLLEVRGMIYELLVHCIPPGIVISTLAKRLTERVDEALKPEIIHWAAHYEHRVVQGNKPIFHIEAFVAKIMSVYKHFLMGFDDFS
ncbi:DNA clamp loader [Atractiella rhizophila]|nr:DNA clamp loader [Atractiella rhizophila]